MNSAYSNLKKIYSLIYGNFMASVQAIINGYSEYKNKSKQYDCQWLLHKGKSIVSGLDTKVNKMVLMHGTIFSFLKIWQFQKNSMMYIELECRDSQISWKRTCTSECQIDR